MIKWAKKTASLIQLIVFTDQNGMTTNEYFGDTPRMGS